MNILKELQKYFDINKLYSIDSYELPGNEFVFSIEGDWKHDHLRADYLVDKFCNINGFILKDQSMDVTEDDGSDYYTADHYYKIVENI